MTTPESFAPGYRLTDGNQLNFRIANPQWSTTSAVSATSGGTMLTSAKVVNAVTNITNASVPGAGITLPQAIEGTALLLSNNSSNDVRVFADGNSTINGLDGQIGIMLAKGTTGIFIAVATKQWSQLNTTNATSIFTVDSIATLRALGVNLFSAVLVEGYYTPGDGGGGYFYGKTGGSFTDNGGTIIVYGGGTGTSAWVRESTENVNVKEFGAKGDDVQDDAPFIQNAITAAASNNSIYFPPGKYRVGSQINISASNLTIYGNGALIDSRVGVYAGTFYLSGTAGSLLPVTSDITAGTTTFTLSSGDAASLSVGDYVKILSDENYFTMTGRDYKKGEIAQVASVSGTTVTIVGYGFVLGYTVSGYTVTAQKITPIENIVIEGLDIEGQGSTFAIAQIGIWAKYCKNLIINSCKLSNFLVGTELDTCLFSTVESCFISKCNEPTTGYGIAVGNSSQNINVLNCSFDNNRHAWTTGGYDGVCMYLSVRNCLLQNHLVTTTIQSHGNARYVDISNNIISNCFSGIGTSNPYTTIHGNYIANIHGTGIYSDEAGNINVDVQNNVIDTCSTAFLSAIFITNDVITSEQNQFVVVNNNTVRNCPNGGGIAINANNPLVVNVANNVISHYGYQGIVVNNGDQINVNNNLIFNPARSGYYGISVTATASPNPISVYGSSAVITNNNLPNVAYGIKVDKPTTLVLQGNLVNSDPSYVYTITNVTTVLGLDVLQSPNGSLWRVAVSNAGVLSATSI